MTMPRYTYVYAIIEQFALIATKLKLSNCANLTDFNVLLEPTFCQVLNILNGWDMVSQNVCRANAPGIDFADPNRRICVQLSSKISVPKVKKTLRVFLDHKLNEKYDELYIVFISDADWTSGFFKSCEAIETGDFPFCPREHIWSLQSLTKLVASAELGALIKITELLEEFTSSIRLTSDSIRFYKRDRHPDPYFLQPPPSSKFFIPDSRKADIAKIYEAMAYNEPVYITGPGGVGKTELALKMARNDPLERVTYYMKYTSTPRAGESFMQTSILEASFGGEPFNSEDPNARKKECLRRIQIMSDWLDKTIMILDGFDMPGETMEALKCDPHFRALTTMGSHLIITARSSPVDPDPYSQCEVQALDKQLLTQHIYRCCAGIQAPEKYIPKLVDLFDRNTMMISLVIHAINHAGMTPEQLLAMHHSAAPASHTAYTPQLFLWNMRSKYDHEETLPEERKKILAFFKAIQAFVTIGDQLLDWYQQQTIAEGGLCFS